MPEIKERKKKRQATDQPVAKALMGEKRTAATASGPLPSMPSHQVLDSDWPFPTDYCDHFEVRCGRPPRPRDIGAPAGHHVLTATGY